MFQHSGVTLQDSNVTAYLFCGSVDTLPVFNAVESCSRRSGFYVAVCKLQPDARALRSGRPANGLYVYRCNVGDAKNSRSPYSPGPAMAHGTYAHIPKEDAHIASKGRSHTARLP